MNEIFRHKNAIKNIADNEPQLNLTLYSRSDYSHHSFCVPAQMTVGDFLELALERLAQGKGADRVQALMSDYAPVLEIPTPDGGRELPDDKTLAEAGVFDHAICRIIAKPRKERIMFCRYSNYS